VNPNVPGWLVRMAITRVYVALGERYHFKPVGAIPVILTNMYL